MNFHLKKVIFQLNYSKRLTKEFNDDHTIYLYVVSMYVQYD